MSVFYVLLIRSDLILSQGAQSNHFEYWRPQQNLFACVFELNWNLYVIAIAFAKLACTLPALGIHIFNFLTLSLACDCDPMGTVNNDVNNCSPADGQCKCKSEHMTSGRRCDTCAEKAYMNDEFGCSACDQCDSLGSLGTCRRG